MFRGLCRNLKHADAVSISTNVSLSTQSMQFNRVLPLFLIFMLFPSQRINFNQPHPSVMPLRGLMFWDAFRKEHHSATINLSQFEAIVSECGERCIIAGNTNFWLSRKLVSNKFFFVLRSWFSFFSLEQFYKVIRK